MQLLTEFTCSLETKSNISGLVIFKRVKLAQSKDKLEEIYNGIKTNLGEFQFWKEDKMKHVKQK